MMKKQGNETGFDAHYNSSIVKQALRWTPEDHRRATMKHWRRDLRSEKWTAGFKDIIAGIRQEWQLQTTVVCGLYVPFKVIRHLKPNKLTACRCNLR